MHLTNYAINKWSQAYRNNQFAVRDNIGHKRSLTAILKYLKQQREDTDGLMERIEDIIIKTIILAKPTISHNYHACQPEDYSNSMCFEILGFDIFIDEELNPFLLEVNETPSFATNSPLDWSIKKAVVLSSLKIANISSQNREKWNFREKFLHIQRKFHGFTWKLSPDQKETIKDKIREKRNDWENTNLGGFKRIYPTENSDTYDKFIDSAEEIYQKFTGIKKVTRKLSPDLLSTSIDAHKKKSQSVKKLSSANVDPDELYSRLAQIPTRKVKTKLLPKVIYHHHDSTKNILKMSPSNIQKIELGPKPTKLNSSGLSIGHKNRANLPMDIKIVHRKTPAK
jgi:tubulin polyglutamylase TTLL6/13